jgi:hypothetical protein
MIVRYILLLLLFGERWRSWLRVFGFSPPNFGHTTFYYNEYRIYRESPLLELIWNDFLEEDGHRHNDPFSGRSFNLSRDEMLYCKMLQTLLSRLSLLGRLLLRLLLGLPVCRPDACIAISIFLIAFVWVAITCSWECVFFCGFLPIYGCLWCWLLCTLPGDRSLQLLCYPFLINLSTFSENKEYHELVLEARRLLSDLLPGSGLSGQLLLSPKKYQALLEEADYEFRRQLLRHGYGDDKIDSLCEEINRILAEAAEAQRILSLMRILEALSKLLTLVIMVCIFEFPNNLRPPSTTMPWIIVPALFVLWGVCWMFINHDFHFTFEDNDADELESESVFVSPCSNDTDLLPDAFLSLQNDPLLVERVDSKYSRTWRE